MRLAAFLAATVMVIGQIAAANGWECEGKNSTYEVRVYNHVKNNATKVPATVLVTRGGEFVALAKEIDVATQPSEFTGPKTESGQQKVYTVVDFAYTSEVLKDLKGLTLKVNGNPDSEKLEYNTPRAAELVLDSAKGVDQKLTCYYYLKGERQKENK